MMSYEAVLGWEVSSEEKELLETIKRVGKRGRERMRTREYVLPKEWRKVNTESHHDIDQGED